MGTRILGLVLEYDSLLTQGHSADVAVQTLRLRAARFGSELIEQFGQHVGAGTGPGPGAGIGSAVSSTRHGHPPGRANASGAARLRGVEHVSRTNPLFRA